MKDLLIVKTIEEVIIIHLNLIAMWPIGTKIKFITNKSNPKRIPNFYVEYVIPRALLRHDNTEFKINQGTVVDTHNEYYIVEFVDNFGEHVRLGFREEVLTKLVRNQADYIRIQEALESLTKLKLKY